MSPPPHPETYVCEPHHCFSVGWPHVTHTHSCMQMTTRSNRDLVTMTIPTQTCFVWILSVLSDGLGVCEGCSRKSTVEEAFQGMDRFEENTERIR
jgi:hypothetical protein